MRLVVETADQVEAEKSWAPAEAHAQVTQTRHHAKLGMDALRFDPKVFEVVTISLKPVMRTTLAMLAQLGSDISANTKFGVGSGQDVPTKRQGQVAIFTNGLHADASDASHKS